ncbi:hypothetical protein [Actinoplanes couchii]|uniref:Fibronectin type-III domain-containing protein n=1 Tax=Actinoplanes couchii TaxID=403638 RepID=A0ABQ3WZZ4_9ACTN|nr:hypothetical protein [Actinoplanes couchii]MDR6316105.1 hypothetical protein [Actinoplanes couchii]GID51720.1 hypothetical protein Aco03nite_001240 [Actinoplanes couchii]
MTLSGFGSLLAMALLAPGATAAPAPETRTVVGTVESVIVDPLPDAPAGGDRMLTLVRADGKLFEVPPGELDGAASGRRAKVELEGTTVVSAELTGSTKRAQAAASGAHELTLLPVFWTAKDDATRESLTALANQAKTYWSEQSNGGVDISVDVRDWQQIAAPSGSCDYTAIFNAAIAAHGVDAPANARDHIGIYFPKQSGCAWAGLGSVNGPMIWVNGTPLEDVLTHEFGHNLGLGHANKATCTANGARVSLSSSCTVAEYQDATDVMGYARNGFASGNLNSAFGDFLGLQQTTTTSPATLSALSAHTGTSGLKLETSSGTVFVDYRPATGRDVRVPAWAGVQVRLRTTGSSPTTQLLDMQPSTSTSFSAPNLPVGGVWLIPGGKQSVKVTSAADGIAKVEVVTATDTTAPSVAPVVSVTTPVKTATGTVTWTAAVDPDSGISAYRVLVNGQKVADTDGATLTADVPLTEGSNSIVVVAVNGAGLIKNSVTKTLVRDSTAPAAVTNVKVDKEGRTVTWVAPADRGTARSYAVTVDGELVKTVAQSPAGIAAAPGRRTVSVTATDAAGNVGATAETTLWIDSSVPLSPAITAPAAGVWLSSRQVTVSWTPASAPGSGIASYTLSLNGKTVTVDGDARSATLTVSGDGIHTASLVARNMAGQASRTVTVPVRVDTAAPAAPSGIRLATDQSKLSWAAASAAGSPVSWEVQVDDGTAVTVTKPEFVNQAAGGQHTWTITPVDAAGNIGPSGTFTKWTDSTPPTKPVITSPAADSFSRDATVTVMWNPSADTESGIGSYLVTAGTQKATVTGTSWTYRPTDGRQNVTVTAVNRAGLSSTPASLGYTYDKTAPSLPGRVVVTGADANTVLTWTASTDKASGVDEYVLFLDGNRADSVPANATTATVTTPPGKHTWSITAVDRAGNSSRASSAGAIWFDTTAPSPAVPEKLPEMVSARAVKVSWAPAIDAESGIKTYAIVATDGTRTVRAAATATATSGAVTVPDNGTWQITVQAVNQTGLTAEADAGSVLVDSTVLGAPTITSPVSKGSTGTSFTVTWTPPALAGPSGITAYRVTVNGRLYGTVDGSALALPVTVTAPRATTMSVSVAAVSGAGIAGRPATVTFSVKPEA